MPRGWLTSVDFFDTILSGQLSLQEADKAVAADLMEQTRFSSVTLAGAEFVHNVSILLVLGLRREALTVCKRSGENQGLKTNPSVAGWQARQCWCKCSGWIGRRSVLETFWRLYGRGKNVIEGYKR